MADHNKLCLKSYFLLFLRKQFLCPYSEIICSSQWEFFLCLEFRTKISGEDLGSAPNPPQTSCVTLSKLFSLSVINVIVHILRTYSVSCLWARIRPLFFFAPYNNKVGNKTYTENCEFYSNEVNICIYRSTSLQFIDFNPIQDKTKTGQELLSFFLTLQYCTNICYL